MEASFWHSRWDQHAIAFHEGRPNALLVEHFDALELAPGGIVLVPLCGKAVDMRWLAERGHPVLGVELSDIATRGFFDDNGWSAELDEVGPFRRYRGHGVTLLAGDFFALTAAHCESVAAVYDRAALVALPAPMRARYVTHLLDRVGPHVPMLTVTFEYDQAEMDGPPFSVDGTEVRAHFEPARPVRKLASHAAIEQAPALRDRGLTALEEHAFLIGPAGGGAS